MRWLVLILPVPFALSDYLKGYWLADPAAELSRWTGDWSLGLLIVCLAMGPLSRAGYKWAFPWRKVLGVSAALYALLHAVVFLWLYLWFDVSRLAHELIERPYIIVGATAWLALMMLLATSNQCSRRRLKQRWLSLHKLIFVVWGLGLLHFFWLVRASYSEWLLYAGASFAVIGLRMWSNRKRKQRQAVKGL